MAKRDADPAVERRAYRQGPHPILGIFFWSVSAAGLVYAVGSMTNGEPGGAVLGIGIFLFSGLMALADRKHRRRARRDRTQAAG